MGTKIAFVTLGIAVAIAGFVAPFDQGLNNLFYPLVGIGIAIYGVRRARK